MAKIITVLFLVISLVGVCQDRTNSGYISAEEALGNLYFQELQSVKGGAPLFNRISSSREEIMVRVERYSWGKWGSSDRMGFIFGYLDFVGVDTSHSYALVDLLKKVNGEIYARDLSKYSNYYALYYFGDKERGRRVSDGLTVILHRLKNK